MLQRSSRDGAHRLVVKNIDGVACIDAIIVVGSGGGLVGLVRMDAISEIPGVACDQLFLVKDAKVKG